MEPVAELKRICQKKGANEKGIKKAYRNISFYLTKFLLYFHLNANQVSIMGVEIGLFASAFFLFATEAVCVVGSGTSFMASKRLFTASQKIHAKDRNVLRRGSQRNNKYLANPCTSS